MGDILIASPTKEDSDENTTLTLNFLGQWGYRVSPQKTQTSKEKVQYLGYVLTPEARTLAQDRKSSTLNILVPQTTRQLRTFLSMLGFCCIWIPGFSLMAKLFYKALQGSDLEPLEWNDDCHQDFKGMKEKLSTAPVLVLPNLEKILHLICLRKDRNSLVCPNSKTQTCS